MAIEYNQTDINAIDQKMQSPASVVICPRCGKELAYRSVGNSCEVKCPTDGCIKGTSRGL